MVEPDQPQFNFVIDDRGTTYRYDKTKPVGQGANSTVYQCRQLSNNRLQDNPMIAKILNKPAVVNFKKQTESAIRNEKIYEKLQNVPTILKGTVIVGPQSVCIVAPKYKCNLHSYYQDTKIKYNNLWRICTSVVAALEAAHVKGIIHRDIKPSNIFINYTGECDCQTSEQTRHQNCAFYDIPTPEEQDDAVVVGDWGECRIVSSQAMTVGRGTYTICAPEIYTGNYGALVDIWSFGSMLFEIITGQYLVDQEDSDSYNTVSQESSTYERLSYRFGDGREVYLRVLLADDEELRPFGEVVKDTLRFDSNERPPADKLLERLQTIESSSGKYPIKSPYTIDPRNEQQTEKVINLFEQLKDTKDLEMTQLLDEPTKQILKILHFIAIKCLLKMFEDGDDERINQKIETIEEDIGTISSSLQDSQGDWKDSNYKRLYQKTPKMFQQECKRWDNYDQFFKSFAADIYKKIDWVNSLAEFVTADTRVKDQKQYNVYIPTWKKEAKGLLKYPYFMLYHHLLIFDKEDYKGFEDKNRTMLMLLGKISKAKMSRPVQH